LDSATEQRFYKFTLGDSLPNLSSLRWRSNEKISQRDVGRPWKRPCTFGRNGFQLYCLELEELWLEPELWLLLELELGELFFLLSSLPELELEELEELELEELGLEVELELELELELEELGLEAELEELGLEAELEELGLELEELGLELAELGLEFEEPFFLDFDLEFLILAAAFLLPLAMSCLSPSRVSWKGLALEPKGASGLDC
jgi:hypothetical protein